MARQYNKALNHPVMTSGVTESSEMEIGQSADRHMQDDGLSPSLIAMPGDRPVDLEKQAMLKFMMEPVTVRIATSTDRNAEQCFEININGRLEFFRRGETKTVPRYFVDRLMRLKTTVYGQDRKSTRLNSSHIQKSRMPSSA